jgi:hypothetical protein
LSLQQAGALFLLLLYLLCMNAANLHLIYTSYFSLTGQHKKGSGSTTAKKFL